MPSAPRRPGADPSPRLLSDATQQMTPAIRGIRDVTERHLCSGCGACAYARPDAIQMVDDIDQGRRPLVDEEADTKDALSVCPGVELVHDFDRSKVMPELANGWGPVREIWEGWAAEPEVRFEASSGGAATALGLFGVESLGLGGVLHITARKDAPTFNETRLSTDRGQILEALGSRYAPASPCDGLALAEEAEAPVVFVGKPCDTAAVHKARKTRPALDEKIEVTIAIFCAGAPSTKGTHEMLRSMGFDDPEGVDSVRYRGKGWPGRARGKKDDREESLTYADSWGKVLQRFVPWRCRICPDHTGEFADISVGDPWYHGSIPDGEVGRSLVIARTERGAAFLKKAREAGVLELEPRGPEALTRSQPNLLAVRGAVLGRVFMSRLLGAAAPRYRGFSLFRTWLFDLTLKQRAQSFYGTVKRVFVKGLRKRRPTIPYDVRLRDPESPPGARAAEPVAVSDQEPRS